MPRSSRCTPSSEGVYGIPAAVWAAFAYGGRREAVVSVPGHIAITMDGNGRWAQRMGKPRLLGHRAGAEVAKRIVLAAPDMGVRVMTLYAFSTENWKRPAPEVRGIFQLLEEFFAREIAVLAGYGIQVRVIGDRLGLPPSIQSAVDQSEQMTGSGRRMLVNIALNYGGRWDIVQAMRSISADVEAGRVRPGDITEGLVSSRLSTSGQPDPDLLIRTGGEHRISNFLLWQSAYSEMYVTPVLWPDFTPELLKEAIQEYRSRHRRFGAVGAQGEGSGGGEGS